MALSGDAWVRRFLVTEPQQHRKGFTVYKVTSIVYPKASPEAITKVVVWKRYNDFKKLYRELQQRHQKLYLKDSFPPFSKSTLFGRFEEEVIEERRICALRLLEFAAEQSSLFTSQVFVKFFESGYSMGSSRHEDQNASLPFMDDTELFGDPLLPDPILRPLENTVRTASVESLEPCNTNVDALANRLENSSGLLGGTWRAPRATIEDSLSLGSSLSSENDEHTTDTDSPGSEEVSTPQRGRDLLQFFDPLCEETRPARIMEETNIELLSNIEPEGPSTGTSLLVQQESFPGPPPLPSDDSCHGAGYIFEAACQVSQAQQHEANAQYEGAFAFYKAGIAVLLSGVQGDTDAIRRQIVKDKTAKYLMRAERIYNMYLTGNTEDKPKWASSAISFARPAAELQNYKVLGVVGKCMLAADISFPMQDCFVMKALYKSPCPNNPAAELIIPQRVPFMVQLLKFHETEAAIFMVLQHASGGKLWDHIGAYLYSGGAQATPSHLLGLKNTYLGQKMLNENEEEGGIDIAPRTRDTNKQYNLQLEDTLLVAQDLTTPCTEDECGNNTDGYINFSNSSDEIPGRNGLNRSRFSWIGLDTAELVQNAQKLLQSVSATLQRSDTRISAENMTRSEKPSVVQYIVADSSKEETSDSNGASMVKCKSEEKDDAGARARERRRSSSGRSKSSVATSHLGSNRARNIERRYSCDDLLEGRGSLELGGRRLSRPLELVTKPRLPEATVRQWAAQIVLALEGLHSCGIVFRDLRPDNVLLGSDGRILLTFCGQWPGVDAVVNNQASEWLYAAPEARGISTPTFCADWWSMGALLFELLTGKTLLSCHPGGIHSHTILYVPDWVSAEARSLLIELLKPDPYERLGSGSHGMENIRSHPFFTSVPWDCLRSAGLPNIHQP